MEIPDKEKPSLPVEEGANDKSKDENRFTLDSYDFQNEFKTDNLDFEQKYLGGNVNQPFTLRSQENIPVGEKSNDSTEEKKQQTTQSEPGQALGKKDSFFELNRGDKSFDSFVNLEKAIMNAEHQTIRSDGITESYKDPQKTQETLKPSTSTRTDDIKTAELQFKTDQTAILESSKQNEIKAAELKPSLKDNEQKSKNTSDSNVSKPEKEVGGSSKNKAERNIPKTAEKTQENVRQVSLSPPDGIDDGMQLKHFRKSKLFQKFIKETTDKSEKTKPSQANQKSKQKSSSKSPIKDGRNANRVRTDENNILKINPSDANLKPRKPSPGQEKYVSTIHDSEEDSVLMGRDHRLSRSKILTENYFSKLNASGRREDNVGLDAHSQSFNLNYQSASQYLPVMPLTQSANYSAYLGVAPYLGSIVEEPSSQPRNLIIDSKLITETSDVFLLKAKLLETTKALERESETNKILEKRCQDLIIQLEKIIHETEEVKQQHYQEKKAHREEISIMEVRLQNLRDKSHSENQTEEVLHSMIDDLKRKLASETNAKAKLAEEKEKIQRRLDQFNKKDKDFEDSSEKLHDQIAKLKEQANVDQQELSTAKKLNEQLMIKVKELESDNKRLKIKNEETSKRLQDQKQEYNLLLLENDSLQSQTANVSLQYKLLLNESEKTKDNLFEAKQELIELRQYEMNSKLIIEKYSRDINHLQSIIKKSEKSFGEQSKFVQELNEELNKIKGSVVSQQRAETIKRRVARESGRLSQHSSPEQDNEPENRRRSEVSNVFSRNDKGELKFKSRISEKYSIIESTSGVQGSENRVKTVPDREHNTPRKNTKQPSYTSFLNSRLNPEAESPKKASLLKFEDAEKLSSDRREAKFSSTLKDFREMRLERQLQNSRSPRKHNRSEDRDTNAKKEDDILKQYKPYYKRDHSNRSPIDEATREGSMLDAIIDTNKQSRQKGEVNKSDPKLLAWSPNDNEQSFVSPGRRVFREKNASSISFGGEISTARQLTVLSGLTRNDEVQTSQEPKQKAKAPKRTVTPEREHPAIKKKQSLSPIEIELHEQEIKALENELMSYQIKRDKLVDELQQLEKVKLKSSANIAKKKEIEKVIDAIQNDVNTVRAQIRDISVNVLHKNY